MIGRTISHYTILEKLGEGGMGVVYKAEDIRLKRLVALKALHTALAEDSEEKSRFVREAQASAALDHPNIAAVHEIEEVEDEMFIIMSYVEGLTLKEISKFGPLPVAQALDFAIQIACGLKEAHDKGIIHRDIKSENIMVTPRGQVKITDFGLAKLKGGKTITKSGAQMGTAGYMSPEQIRGEPANYQSDIFSFGVTLYEMLTGQRPFKGESDQAVMFSILYDLPQPISEFSPKVPDELEEFVEKAMMKEKCDRYPSVDELLADLKKVKSQMTLGREIAISERFARDTNKQKPVFRRLRTQSESQPFAKKAMPTIKKSPGIYRSIIYGSGVILSILLIYAGLRFLVERSVKIDSIAVLPLANLSSDPEQGYLADGMTDALIFNLAKISELRVISRTSVMRYRNTIKSLPEISEELNVDVVVEGSVLRLGHRVRITVQLIEAATDQHLWVESYDRDLREILLLQSEVAQSIAREIKVTVTSEEEARLTSARPVNPEAYQAYLKGSYFWDKHSEEGLRKSIKYYEDAIRKDPAYANAYAGLGQSYMSLGAPGIEALSPGEIMPKARTAMMKALELDDLLAEAHAGLGYVKLTYDWDWAAAEREFKQAIELNPGYALAHLYYSLYLTIVGRHEEAIAMNQRALELDPLSLTINVVLGNQFFNARQYDQAIQHHRIALEMNPNNWHVHWSLGMAFTQMRIFEEAILELEKAVILSERNPSVLSSLGYTYAVAGRKIEAMKILEELKDLSRRKYIAQFAHAQIHTGLGNKDQAFDCLEKGVQERSTTMAWVGVTPMLDSLRSDPRFTEMLKKMRLVR